MLHGTQVGMAVRLHGRVAKWGRGTWFCHTVESDWAITFVHDFRESRKTNLCAKRQCQRDIHLRLWGGRS